MTMLEDDDAVCRRSAPERGGTSSTGAQQDEILDVIRSVHAGRAVIGATVARQLSALVSGAASRIPSLTSRHGNATCSGPQRRSDPGCPQGPGRRPRQVTRRTVLPARRKFGAIYGACK